MVNFDLNNVPFSTCGSYMVISRMNEHFEGPHIRTIRGRECLSPVLKLEMTNNGEVVEHKEYACPSYVRFSFEEKQLTFTFQDDFTVRCEGNGGLNLKIANSRPYSFANTYTDNKWEIVYGNNYKMMLTVLKGKVNFNAPFDRVRCTTIEFDIIPDESGKIDIAVEEFATAYISKELLPVLECIKAMESSFKQWLDKTVDAPADLLETRDLCAYVDYVSVVRPDGHHKRYTMYMSKNWMTNVWSWDHCFNVMALTKTNPEFALEQYLTIFDHQNEYGCLPDCVNDRLMIWDYVKTPVHGWTILYMLRNSDYLKIDKLNKLYEPLKRWTDWWFNYRDYDHDGVPQYNCGLDTGWDNNSIFAGYNLVEAPDLMAFLILQMDALAIMAEKIDRQKEKLIWEQRSAELLEKLISHSWDGERFIARRSGRHDYNTESDSLMNFVPLILGDKLSPEIRQKMISHLSEEGRFLCPFGICTESLRSKYHDPQGYWSGPVWGPATVIIVDGLIKCGAEELAREISRRYCNNMKVNGTAENFNSHTGKGQNDRAYTWSTSAFLTLASYLKEGVF